MLLPTRGRPQWLANYVKHYRLTGAAHQVALLMDSDEPCNYTEVLGAMPENWTVLVDKRAPNSARQNAALKFFPDEAVYAMQCDDAEPQTEKWDEIMCAAALERGIAWPDDGVEQRSTMPFVRGDIVRAVGFIAPPVLKHLHCDTFWGELAAELNIKGLVADVKLKHHKDIDDDTKRQRQDAGDSGAWQTFRNTDFNEIARNLRPCLR